MKVGDYVRTKYGIFKIRNITKDLGYCKRGKRVIELDRNVPEEHYHFRFYKDEAIFKNAKSSPNIIDLIEVGDYVNGEKVIALRKDIEERNIHFNSKDNLIFTDYDLANNWYYGIDTDKIKSIVTKKQFSHMEYKIND